MRRGFGTHDKACTPRHCPRHCGVGNLQPRPFAPADGDSDKVQALKEEAAAIKAQAVEDNKCPSLAVTNWIKNRMEPYMSVRQWAEKSKKLPGRAGQFYTLCQHVDGKMGRAKEVDAQVIGGRNSNTVVRKPQPTRAEVQSRETAASYLGAGGAAEIAEAKAEGDASMAREAATFARSIPFTTPRAAYAPSGAAEFPVSVDIPDDPAEFARFMTGRADRLLKASRERFKDARRPTSN